MGHVFEKMKYLWDLFGFLYLLLAVLVYLFKPELYNYVLFMMIFIGIAVLFFARNVYMYISDGNEPTNEHTNDG